MLKTDMLFHNHTDNLKHNTIMIETLNLISYHLALMQHFNKFIKKKC